MFDRKILTDLETTLASFVEAAPNTPAQYDAAIKLLTQLDVKNIRAILDEFYR